jgi:hypothetical protein
MREKQKTPSGILLDFYTFAGQIHQPWCRWYSAADQTLFMLTPGNRIGLQILQKIVIESEL